MKINRFFILVVSVLCFVTNIQAQKKGRVRITNGFSIQGGATLFDIITDNFETSQGVGFLGGLHATVDLPHKWYNVSLGMLFSQNNIGISARPTLVSLESEDVDFKILAVQLNPLFHIKIIPKHISLHLGPSIQYNGQLDVQDMDQEGYFINNYINLTAEDIRPISQINVNGIVGASVGIKHFKLTAKYMYGFTNILGNLDDENLNTLGGASDFEGNASALFLGATLQF
jgi:hypothetical protein